MVSKIHRHVKIIGSFPLVTSCAVLLAGKATQRGIQLISPEFFPLLCPLSLKKYVYI